MSCEKKMGGINFNNHNNINNTNRNTNNEGYLLDNKGLFNE